MQESESTILSTRDSFFAQRGWQRKCCPSCLEDYYTKRDFANCGSYRCVGGYSFLNIPSPKQHLELDACARRIREFFQQQGYPLQKAIAVVRSDERTLFASTAGQVYDELIYGQSTQEQWLDLFSSLGLHVGGLCLKSNRAENDWAGRTVTSEMLKVNYQGLEIGVANYFFDIPQVGGTVASLSDIGFGLERLGWAVNKSPSYFDGTGPLSNVTIISRVTLDAIRTATLMASSGIIPDHKNQGSKLRAMVGLISDEAERLNLYELVRYYYSQWASLIDLPRDREHTYSVIWQEVNRSLNLETNRALGIDEPFEQDHEEFLRGAVQKKIIPITRLWDIAKKKT